MNQWYIVNSPQCNYNMHTKNEYWKITDKQFIITYQGLNCLSEKLPVDISTLPGWGMGMCVIV